MFVAHSEPLRPRVEALVTRVADRRIRVETVRVETTVRLVVRADVLFAFDSARLGAAAHVPLDAVRVQAAGRCVDITGFTDSRGTGAYNLELSRRRAEAVRAALGMGCAAVDGRGEADPVASNETAAGRARNRRVEIRLG